MTQSFTKNVPLDDDVTLAGNSSYIAPTQHAVKSYIDNLLPDEGWYPIDDTMLWESTFEVSPTFGAYVTKNYSQITRGMRLRYKQTQALTGYWSFDASSAADVGAFTMANVGSPTYAAGVFSNALTLNGTNQALSITDVATLKPTGEFTICAWVKATAISASPNHQFIFQSYSQNTAVAGIQFRLDFTTGYFTFITGKNTGTVSGVDYSTVTAPVNCADNAWHYLTATVRNNWCQLYIDGVLSGSGYVIAPAYAATNYIRIGCANLSGSNSSFLGGQIDDLFIINGYALDEKTIKAKRLQYTAQGTGLITITKYGIMTKDANWSPGSPLTQFTFYGGTDYTLANATITEPYYSNIKFPTGFPIQPTKWTVFVADYADKVKTTSTGGTWYGQANALDSSRTLSSIVIPIGLWKIMVDGCAGANLNPGTALNIYTTLSSSTSLELDKDFSSSGNVGGASGTLYCMATFHALKYIEVSTPTTHYMLMKSTVNATALTMYGTIRPNLLRAECAYL